MRPLADASVSATGGALTTIRVTTPEGGDGARPHRHADAAELLPSNGRHKAEGTR